MPVQVFSCDVTCYKHPHYHPDYRVLEDAQKPQRVKCNTTCNSTMNGFCTCRPPLAWDEVSVASPPAAPMLLEQDRDIWSKVLSTHSQQNPFCLTLLWMLSSHLQARLHLAPKIGTLLIAGDSTGQGKGPAPRISCF